MQHKQTKSKHILLQSYEMEVHPNRVAPVYNIHFYSRPVALYESPSIVPADSPTSMSRVATYKAK